MTPIELDGNGIFGVEVSFQLKNFQSRQIDLPLKSITLTLGNVHIYENNIDSTKRLLKGEKVSFELNV